MSRNMADSVVNLEHGLQHKPLAQGYPQHTRKSASIADPICFIDSLLSFELQNAVSKFEGQGLCLEQCWKGGRILQDLMFDWNKLACYELQCYSKERYVSLLTPSRRCENAYRFRLDLYPIHASTL